MKTIKLKAAPMVVLLILLLVVVFILMNENKLMATVCGVYCLIIFRFLKLLNIKLLNQRRGVANVRK